MRAGGIFFWEYEGEYFFFFFLRMKSGNFIEKVSHYKLRVHSINVEEHLQSIPYNY